ncbi:isoaspartyl peptidase/L-asparaginase [Vibrio sp. SS-MA-C1-2]|uniref:isoaspartyl peptidase/L-asparaginase family protein n=1 Tax=Vibrio sp. SS-MA-C1-2 TaxID=2908646 RepID=UPI001F2CA1F3|nr:isoaspartyl peptidase/L-asparaginase [Vibrio sp. SS-MA-C1-2]UJF18459.1 isoaspartyl peptidase/L-asparaginase [Vibrio sp. SS-MA-C1-2]
MYSIAIHGGAGAIQKANITSEQEKMYHQGLRDAIDAGEVILKSNGSAVDAVAAAVCSLENNPIFNAGRGSVFTSKGDHEMDAAIMDGKHRNVGAVAGICGPQNPIKAAQLVLEKSPHVFFVSNQAEELCKTHNLPFKDKSYFHTDARWNALQEALRLKEEGKISDDPAVRHGTVGAVALDKAGNLAAATSTGGMTAKEPGRVGDSPVIGSGTFADNRTCAISATGHGEIFIRFTVGCEIDARMKYLGESLEKAANHVVMGELLENDGTGGIIAVDFDGNITMPFNSEGMYRAAVKEGESITTAIYK